jgi:hypothetical protein
LTGRVGEQMRVCGDLCSGDRTGDDCGREASSRLRRVLCYF